MQLIKYQLSDGAIVGGWGSNATEILEANIVEDDAVYGYLLTETAIGPFELQADYKVVDGAVVPKTP